MFLIFCLLITGILIFVQFFIPVAAFAAWTPLLSAADFTGIQTDVSTAVAGIISIALIILGATLLIGAMRH
jgi:hypothetical protein